MKQNAKISRTFSLEDFPYDLKLGDVTPTFMKNLSLQRYNKSLCILSNVSKVYVKVTW